MSEIQKHRWEDHPDIDYLENVEDLEAIIEEIEPYVGRVIIEFNSLEYSLESCIAELVSRSGSDDDRIYVFLSEMMFRGKAKALINLYGQLIEDCSLDFPKERLADLEKRFEEAARIRNEYAHANWEDITKKRYVCVKTKASKKGIHQKYRLFDIPQMEKDIDSIIETQTFFSDFDENIGEAFARN